MKGLSQLKIEQYRGIVNLYISELNRINLVIGDNNCGKTSVLEALQLLRTSGDLANIYRIARQRESLSIMNSISLFESFLCMFPKNNNDLMEISVSGTYDDQPIDFSIHGGIYKVLLDVKEIYNRINRAQEFPRGEIETDVFDGTIDLTYGKYAAHNQISVNTYSRITDAQKLNKDVFKIIYVKIHSDSV